MAATATAFREITWQGNTTSSRSLEPVAAQHAEQTLLHRLAQGEHAAFWHLWPQYQRDFAYRHCLRWMHGDHAEAEDALSRAALKIWRKLPAQAQKITHFKGWVAQTLRHLCIDIHRERAQRLRTAQLIDNFDIVCEESPAMVQESAEDTLLRREMAHYIAQALDALPPRLRQPAQLYFCQEASAQDIARRLHLSVTNVRKRLQIARKMLREHIQSYLTGQKDVGSEQALSTPSALADIEMTIGTQEDQAPREISAHYRALRLVRIALPSGVHRDVTLPLEHPPIRVQQKVNTLRAYIQQHPEGWKKQLQLAHLLYSTGAWTDAIAAYRQVLAKHPQCLEASLRLGHILQLLRREADAVAVYQQALPLVYSPATQAHLTGLIAVCSQRPAAAIPHFEAAARREPENPAHWQTLGLTCLRAARPVEALQAFDHALQGDPQDIVALTYSADALAALGRWQEARQRAAQALADDIYNVPALRRLVDCHTHLGWVQGEEGQHTEKLVRQLARLAPHAAEVQAALGRYHLARGERARCHTVLRTFTVRHPHDPLGWYHYACWCARTGDTATAKLAIQQASTLDPYDATIAQALDEMASTTQTLPHLAPDVA